MDYLSLVHVVNSRKDLPYQVAGFRLVEVSTFPDVLEEIATLTKFHHQYVLPFELKHLVQFHQVRVVEPDRHQNLSEDFAAAILIVHNKRRLDDLGCPQQSSILHLDLQNAAVCTLSDLLLEHVILKVVLLLDLHEGVPVDSYPIVFQLLFLLYEDFFQRGCMELVVLAALQHWLLAGGRRPGLF